VNQERGKLPRDAVGKKKDHEFVVGKALETKMAIPPSVEKKGRGRSEQRGMKSVTLEVS